MNLIAGGWENVSNNRQGSLQHHDILTINIYAHSTTSFLPSRKSRVWGRAHGNGLTGAKASAVPTRANGTTKDNNTKMMIAVLIVDWLMVCLLWCMLWFGGDQGWEVWLMISRERQCYSDNKDGESRQGCGGPIVIEWKLGMMMWNCLKVDCEVGSYINHYLITILCTLRDTTSSHRFSSHAAKRHDQPQRKNIRITCPIYRPFMFVMSWFDDGWLVNYLNSFFIMKYFQSKNTYRRMTFTCERLLVRLLLVFRKFIVCAYVR